MGDRKKGDSEGLDAEVKVRQAQGSSWGSSGGKLHPAMPARRPDEGVSEARDGRRFVEWRYEGVRGSYGSMWPWLFVVDVVLVGVPWMAWRGSVEGNAGRRGRVVVGGDGVVVFGSEVQ